MESPSISLIEDFNPAISFAISGEVSLSQLKKTAEEIEDDLKAMEGISKVRISGYPVEELEISVRENDLKKYNLSFQDLHRAIISENIDFTGGTVKSIDENFKIRSNNKKYNSDEIAEIIVKK